MMILLPTLVIAATTLTPLLPVDDLPRIPIVEVIKVYGSLATSECFGLSAPPASSCQLPREILETELGLEVDHDQISRQDFDDALAKLNFRWPLKPFGLNEESLKKTAIMNKGAETRVYMDELERRGLYDRRNPTAPLPTSLRPKLNKALKAEGYDPATVQRVFEALGGGEDRTLTRQMLEQRLGDVTDYYGFLDLIGKEGVEWPN